MIDHAENARKYLKNADIFMGSISSEERFDRGWIISTDNGIRIKKKIIYYFNEVLKASHDRSAEERRFDTTFQLTEQDKKLYVDIYNEVEGLTAFKDCIKDDLTKFHDKKILLDFSVMIKPYFFLLLKYLSTIPLKELYLLYTEPSLYDEFTRGTISGKDVPGYSGAKDPTKKDALILLLGFEGDRALEVLNEVSPNLTIPVNGFPAYRPVFKDRSILENKILLEEEDIFKNLRFAPANDPFETKKVLEDIYSEFRNEYNISVAPLGTKPMALGSCLFALEHSECRIIYPYPMEYLPKSSLGWGNTWIYVMKFLNDI